MKTCQSGKIAKIPRELAKIGDVATTWLFGLLFYSVFIGLKKPIRQVLVIQPQVKPTKVWISTAVVDPIVLGMYLSEQKAQWGKASDTSLPCHIIVILP